MKKMESTINYLLNTRPFYAHFFLNSKIIYDDKNVPTGAAALINATPTLYFNTEFMELQTQEQLAGLVEHEVLHILFDHITTFKEENLLNKDVANIAMDLAINQYIHTLPVMKEGSPITLEGVNKKFGLNLPAFETWEFYYQHLIKNVDKMGSFSTIDNHDMMKGNMSPSEAKAVIRDALDKAIKSSSGNVPEAIAKVFANLSEEAKVPWQQVLANFVAKSISSTVRHSRKKINRRFGIHRPGRIKKRELTLGVCVDSSGSVSDESYKSFMTEIKRISKITQKTYLVDADCVVQDVKVIKKNKAFEATRKGCGGTAYQPAIDECMKLGCDAIVYFGDFDTSDTPKNPGIPFLWVGVGDSKKPGDFGGEIRI